MYNVIYLFHFSYLVKYVVLLLLVCKDHNFCIPTPDLFQEFYFSFLFTFFLACLRRIISDIFFACLLV